MSEIVLAILILFGADFLYRKTIKLKQTDFINAIVCFISAVGIFYYIFNSLKASILFSLAVFLLGEPIEFIHRNNIINNFFDSITQKVKNMFNCLKNIFCKEKKKP